MPIWNLPSLLSITTTTTTSKKRPAPSSPPSTTPTAAKRVTFASSPTTITTPTTNPHNLPTRILNPSISPSTPEFTTILHHFHTLLRDPSQTLTSILSSHFTPHEQDLLRAVESFTPSKRVVKGQKGKGNKRERALARIQEGNRVRYSELLNSERFAEWRGRRSGDLGFKLALAWFGVPVAPIRSHSGVDMDMGGYVVGEIEEREEGKEEGELRFLNGYGERVYGRDVGVRRLDPKMEAYYVREKSLGPGQRSSTSLSLRGGEAGTEDGLDSPSTESGATAEDDAPLEESNQLSIRGGDDDDVEMAEDWDQEDDEEDPEEEDDDEYVQEEEDDDEYLQEEEKDDESSDEEEIWHFHTVLRGPCSNDNDKWIPLYGYQGVVHFRVDMLYTYVDAVDRLLGLDNRAGVTYSLYLMDKTKTYATQAERSEFLGDLTGNGLTISTAGVGDFSHDHLAWEWARNRLAELERKGTPDQKVLFVAGPADPIPWTWEPNESHRVLKLQLVWCNPKYRLDRPDVAYLRMPEDHKDFKYTNVYGPWMESICRLLTPGRIRMSPGHPAIPDAFFTVKVRGRGFSANVGTYGGLAFLPELWELILGEWEKDPAGTVTLYATVESELGRIGGQVPDRWHLFLPGAGLGYKYQYVLHEEIDEDQREVVQERILRLLKLSMSAESFAQLQAVQVHLPGSFFFIPGSQPVHTLPTGPGWDRTYAFECLVSDMVKFKKSLAGLRPAVRSLYAFPQFLALRPVFRRYTICDVDESAEPVAWDPLNTTVAQFQQLVAQVWSAAGHAQQYSPEKTWVALVQGRAGDGSKPAPKKPRLLIYPKLDNAEWMRVRRLIVEPEVFISLVEREDLPYFADIDTDQTFGFRDIYETPHHLLYSKSKMPNPPRQQRYYAWMVTRKNVDPSLKTYLPWHQQPPSLSTLQPHSDFPLVPPPGTKMPKARRHRHATQQDSDDSPHSDSSDGQGPPPGAAPAGQDVRRFEDRRGPGPAGSSSQRQNQHPAGSQGAIGGGGANTAHPANPSSSLVSLISGQTDSLGYRLVTEVEKGARLREHSYAHPLDVRTHMALPVNAPPLDALLNLRLDSVPVVSLSVLTPTEVRRLQRDHHDMRNLVLARAERCPYADCRAVYPVSEKAAMQRHLREKHLAAGCNFCNEPLFEHWSTEQRYKHFMEKHSEVLRSMVPREEDEYVQIADKGRIAHDREGRWHFCARCGRDHSMLDVPADRQHHDNVCYPGVQDREPDWSACGACGIRIEAAAAGKRHTHRENVEAEAPFCERCALPLGLMSNAYQVKHLSFCSGHGRDNAKYCPWCGVELGEDFDERLVHIEECSRKPDPDAEGPIDVANRAYYLPSTSRLSAGDAAEDRPAKRRRADAAPQAEKPPEKKARTSPPAPIDTHRRTSVPAESTGDSLSPPPSSSHSGRSQEAWKPPPQPPAPKPAPPPPAPASPVAAPAAQAPAPAKPAASAKPGPKATAKPKPAKPKNPSPPKKAKQPKQQASAPARATRYNTRGANKRMRGAAETAAAAPPVVATAAVAQTRQTTKPARSVSYAEPLVRGASPPRREFAGEGRVLEPALKRRRVDYDDEDEGESEGEGERAGSYY